MVSRVLKKARTRQGSRHVGEYSRIRFISARGRAYPNRAGSGPGFEPDQSWILSPLALHLLRWQRFM